MAKQHLEIVEGYREKQRGDGWHTLPDDSYIYNQLAHHLKEAGLSHELKGLFADHNWLHVRVPQCNYLYDGYLRDLQLAWDIAYKEYEKQIEQAVPPTALIECFRYTLIRTSVNSIAGDYPPELVARAVELGIWSIERALSVSEKAPTLELYAALLSTGKLNEEQQNQLIQAGYDRVIKRRDHWYEEEVGWWPPSPTVYGFIHDLITMLPYFNGEQRIDVLDFDLKWLFGYGWGKAQWYPGVIEKVASFLSPKQIQEAINIATESFHKSSRPITLSILAGYVDQQQQYQIAEQGYLLAMENQFDQEIARGIAALFPYLHPDQRNEALKRGLLAAEQSGHPYNRVAGLREFIPFTPKHERESFIEYVFKQAMALGWGYGRATNLAELFPYLHPEQKNQAFEIIVNIPANTGEQLQIILTTLYPHLNEEQQQRALQAAMHDAVSDSIPHYKMGLLATLAMYMDEADVRKSLQGALEIGDEEDYIQAVAALIPLVPSRSKEELARWVFARRNKSHISSYPSFNTRVVQTLTDVLPSDLLIIAYEEALNGERSERIKRLVSVLPSLDQKASHKALNKVLTDRNGYTPFPLHIELSQLAPALVGKVQQRGVQLALEELLKLRPAQREDPIYQGENSRYYQEKRDLDDYGMAQDIKRLAPYLSAKQVQTAYKLLMERTETLLCRAEGLVDLLPFLDGTQLENAVQQCFEATRQNNFHPIREDILGPIAKHLTEDMQDEALEYAYRDNDIPLAILTIRKIVPYLTAHKRELALRWAYENAHSVKPENAWRAGVNSLLAPHLEEPDKQRAIQLAFDDLVAQDSTNMSELQRQVEVLVRLVKLSDDPNPFTKAILELILDYLPRLHDEPRSSFWMLCVMLLNQLQPPILAEAIHVELARQIIDVCENWEWV